jgi:biopolymer transport protein TolR
MMGGGGAARTRRSRRALAGMSEINITSFVDVVLVLLIIFMMTSQMMQQGFTVDLPKADTPALERKDEPIVVTLGENKRLAVNETDVEGPEALGRALQAEIQRGGPRSVYLSADRDVPYGAIVRVMESIKAAGIQDVGLITQAGREDWFQR